MAKDIKGHGSAKGYEMPSGKGIPSAHSMQGRAKIKIRDTMAVAPEVAAAARARRGGYFGT